MYVYIRGSIRRVAARAFFDRKPQKKVQRAHGFYVRTADVSCLSGVRSAEWNNNERKTHAAALRVTMVEAKVQGRKTHLYIYIYIHTISQRCAVIVLCLCVTFHAEGPHRTCRADARVATFFRSGFPRTTESPLSLGCIYIDAFNARSTRVCATCGSN